MNLRALVLLHPGLEEMEAVAPIDLLSRAGVEVVQASTQSDRQVTGRSGISWQATHLLTDVIGQSFAATILPGGPGIQQLRGRADIIQCLQTHHQAGRLLACICAAPLILLDAGLLDGLRYTAHPATADELSQAEAAHVVVDRRIITSQGAGTATEFSLAIVEALCGQAQATEIAQAIGYSPQLHQQ
ncbi:MAG: DJ-1 family protein [Puniceicoccaceae bacterium]|nr:MAG: DJ-1 family protein [Puniceicoccaceae bacterium]